MNKRTVNLLCESPHDGHGYAVLESMPDDEQFVEQAILFQQLSDETRLKILYCLCLHEFCVYDLAQLVNMSAPAISHHLRSLRQLRIISSRRAGKHVFYSLAKAKEAEQIRAMMTNIFQIGEQDGTEDISH